MPCARFSCVQPLVWACTVVAVLLHFPAGITALADEKEGLLEAAQQNLLDLLNNFPRSHWPAGAEAALKQIGRAHV